LFALLLTVRLGKRGTVRLPAVTMVTAILGPRVSMCKCPPPKTVIMTRVGAKRTLVADD